MKKEIQTIIKYIEENDKIALFPHNNIDGDSLSSSYGLGLAIKAKYPNKEVKWIANMDEMKINFPSFEINQSMLGEKIDNTWLAIVGDTSSKSKLDELEMIENAKQIVVFDHHRNNIEIKHNYFWHEPDYPASTIQAIEIAKGMNVKFTEEIAYALMLGLLTDTGNFTYSLANPKPVHFYSEMLQHISDKKMDYFWNSFKKKTIKDIEVTKVFLNNLKYEGRVAYVYFDLKLAEQFKDLNYKLRISQIANIENYPIWCFFVEVKTDKGIDLKLHFRSNGPNVSEIAMKYKGGGHIRAAGAKVPLTDNTLSSVLNELNKIAK